MDRSGDLKLPIKAKVSRGQSMDNSQTIKSSESPYNQSMRTSGQHFANQSIMKQQSSIYEEQKVSVIEEQEPGTDDSRMSDARLRELSERLGHASTTSPYNKADAYQNLKNITQQLSTMKKSDMTTVGKVGGQRTPSNARASQVTEQRTPSAQDQRIAIPGLGQQGGAIDLKSVVEAIKSKANMMEEREVENIRSGTLLFLACLGIQLQLSFKIRLKRGE